MSEPCRASLLKQWRMNRLSSLLNGRSGQRSQPHARALVRGELLEPKGEPAGTGAACRWGRA